MRTIKLLALVCSTCLITSIALAETNYISDQLEVTLRSGKSTGHSIIRMLRSGTPVEVLEQDKDSGYSLVRALGKEGWVLTRYLMKGPVPRDQLAEAEKKLAELELQNRKMKTAMQDTLQVTNNQELRKVVTRFSLHASVVAVVTCSGSILSPRR